MLTFESPQFLLLLLIIPIVIFSHSLSIRKSKKRTILFSNYDAIKRVHAKHRQSKNIVWIIFRIIITGLFVFALAGTHLSYDTTVSQADYVLALDASSSMESTDVFPNRFDAAKSAQIAFLNALDESNTKSRVSIITFAGTTFIHSHLLYEQKELSPIVEDLNISYVPGTAIGEAIMNAANILYESDKVKIMYLITDGQSNVGVDVDFALDYAKYNTLTINTIGIGKVNEPLISEGSLTSSLDDETLKKIAAETGGKYYQVTETEQLIEIFKNDIEYTQGRYNRDLTQFFLMSILIMLFIEWVLINTKFKTIP